MVKPLTFKGDKKSKKRKHAKLEDVESPGRDLAPTVANEDESSGDTTWVSADAVSDITGPIIIVLPSSSTSTSTTIPTCLACDVTGKVFASPLENLIENDPSTAEPHDVRQVWVATRVAGTDEVSFKGHHGRYLSCDKFGILSATREAISQNESFRPLEAPDAKGMFAIQWTNPSDGSETYLCVKDEDTKTPQVRGDAQDIGFSSTLRVRMQARFKPKLKASRESKAREKISRRELEEAVGRRLDDDEVKRLKRARREGNYHEEILDVRVKGKHDKFAS